jgi:hypothetical protein
MTHNNPRWMRLDNAAKIYPAVKKRNWSSLFRLSATLTEPLDVEILKKALSRMVRRFPSFHVHIRRGLFWYFFEGRDGYPEPLPDSCCPCEPLRPEENDGFAFRVRYFENRIAVEFFHALTDGTGGLCFLKTLLAEYLTIKYGVAIPRDSTILDCDAPVDPAELEDSFLKYEGGASRGRGEKNSYLVRGTREPDGFVHLTCGAIPVEVVSRMAKEKGVTVTQYLVAVLIMAIDAIQCREVRLQMRRKPVKVSVPINLRRFFPSTTFRNFSSYVNPGIEPHMGEHTFDEVLKAVYHAMGFEITEKNLRAKFTANVRTEKHPLLRVTPLFIKTPLLKLAFKLLGDRKSSCTFTNLGQVTLPEAMKKYVTRMELILGPLSRNPVGCAVMAYEGTIYLNFTRVIREPKVEREFFTRLVDLGIPVTIESNQRC